MTLRQGDAVERINGPDQGATGIVVRVDGPRVAVDWEEGLRCGERTILPIDRLRLISPIVDERPYRDVRIDD